MDLNTLFKNKTNIGNSLTKEIHTLLEKSIIEGKIKPGTKLKEQEISQVFGVSNTPVREAFTMLETDGFVVRKPHRGLYVKEISTKTITEIFDVREALEVCAIKDVVANFREDDLETFDNLKKCGEKAYHTNSIEDYLNYNGRFHRNILSISQNKFLIEILAKVQKKIDYSILITFKIIGIPEANYDEHNQLVDAIERKNLEMARSIMSKHIRGVKERVISSLSKK